MTIIAEKASRGAHGWVWSDGWWAVGDTRNCDGLRWSRALALTLARCGRTAHMHEDRRNRGSGNCITTRHRARRSTLQKSHSRAISLGGRFDWLPRWCHGAMEPRVSTAVAMRAHTERVMYSYHKCVVSSACMGNAMPIVSMDMPEFLCFITRLHTHGA